MKYKEKQGLASLIIVILMIIAYFIKSKPVVYGCCFGMLATFLWFKISTNKN